MHDERVCGISLRLALRLHQRALEVHVIELRHRRRPLRRGQPPRHRRQRRLGVLPRDRERALLALQRSRRVGLRLALRLLQRRLKLHHVQRTDRRLARRLGELLPRAHEHLLRLGARPGQRQLLTVERRRQVALRLVLGLRERRLELHHVERRNRRLPRDHRQLLPCAHQHLLGLLACLGQRLLLALQRHCQVALPLVLGLLQRRLELHHVQRRDSRLPGDH
eukprot:361097-Chlamydomonas_euryale.AAC.1